jgi:hypothetical protein
MDDLGRPILYGGEQLRQEVDRVAGGGPKWHPWSAEEAKATLRPQIIDLETAALQIPDALRGARIVFQATVLPNYLAASWFPESLFEAADLVVLGSRPAVGPYRTQRNEAVEAATKSLLLGATEASLLALDRLSGDGENTTRQRRIDAGFQRLHELRLASAEEVVKADSRPEGPHELFEAVLHPTWDAQRGRPMPANEDVLRKWHQFVVRLGGQVVDDYVRPVGTLTFMPVYLPSDRAHEAAQFNPLRTLRPMPRLRTVPSIPVRAGGNRPAPVAPQDTTPSSASRVAVFDGGCDRASTITGPFVAHHDLTPEGPVPDLLAHGTLVTSAALFGAVDPAQPLPRPSFFVDHYRVLPVPPGQNDQDLNWILDQIVSTIRASQHHVVNLSLGPDSPVDDGDPHRWTAELDQLAEEQDVCFVSAIGNNGEADPALGLNRVMSPGDMANGMGIGAATRPSPEPYARSPFSAVGPGRQGARVKPTGVAFGGDGRSMAFLGVGPGDAWYEDHGTSFATPLVSRSVGSAVPLVVPPGRTSAFLRAFAVQFAEGPENGDLPLDVGHGRFADLLSDQVACPPNAVTVIYQDSIARGEIVGLPFPCPDDMPTGRYRVRWTLAYDSPIDPADAAEYTLAGLEAQFRPHARRIQFTLPDGSGATVVNVGTDPGRATELLRNGYRPAENAATRAGRRLRVGEQARRDEGKWETVVRVDDSMLSTSLFRPRLDLSYFARRGGLLRDQGVPDLPFVLFVTIEGPRHVDCYARVRTSFRALLPLGVRVRPDTRVTI